MFGHWVDEASRFMKLVACYFDSAGGNWRTFSGLRPAGSRLLRDSLCAALLLLAFAVFNFIAPRAEAQDAGPWRAVQVTGVVYVRPADGTLDDWRQ